MIITLAGLAPVTVPEGGATFILFAVALVSLILLRRRISIRKLPTVTVTKTTATALAIAALFVFVSSAVAGPAQLPANVPEAGQTLLLLGLALITVIALRYKLAK
jgi:amino acid transporter